MTNAALEDRDEQMSADEFVKAHGKCDYERFLAAKQIVANPAGFEVDGLSPMLFDFQQAVVSWALRLGRAAIFAGTGLGKTFMQLEWARQVYLETSGDVLVVAPLAVSHQTVREGQHFGIAVHKCTSQADVQRGINITNYERLDRFDLSKFSGIVLDESSILKSHDGATRTWIIEQAQVIPYRLACTATPAPNDHMELANHAEFLGIMRRSEMLSMFFINDMTETQKWRLKGHAESDFWKWVCSWAVMFESPADLGYDGTAFVLPPLRMHQHIVESTEVPEGLLFAVEAQTLSERQGARRASLSARVAKTAEIVAEHPQCPWIIWCDLNAEGDALTAAIPGAVQVAGADDPQAKADAMIAFAEGRIRVLVTKPSIAGFGLNWQHCSRVAFVGLSDSWEQFYQAVRRCWRFGQTSPVDCHVVTASSEGAVVANIQRKEADAKRMRAAMIQHMAVHTAEILHSPNRSGHAVYQPTKIMEVPQWLKAT